MSALYVFRVELNTQQPRDINVLAKNQREAWKRLPHRLGKCDIDLIDVLALKLTLVRPLR